MARVAGAGAASAARCSASITCFCCFVPEAYLAARRPRAVTTHGPATPWLPSRCYAVGSGKLPCCTGSDPAVSPPDCTLRFGFVYVLSIVFSGLLEGSHLSLEAQKGPLLAGVCGFALRRARVQVARVRAQAVGRGGAALLRPDLRLRALAPALLRALLRRGPRVPQPSSPWRRAGKCVSDTARFPNVSKICLKQWLCLCDCP